MRRVLLSVWVASGSAVAGCAEEAVEECTPIVSIEATPPALASGDMLRLTVDIRGMTLLAPGDEPEGEYGENCVGHYKVHLDSAEKAALLSDVEEEVIFAVTADPGEHELIVRLYDPDDVPLLPDVSDTAMLTFQ